MCAAKTMVYGLTMFAITPSEVVSRIHIRIFLFRVINPKTTTMIDVHRKDEHKYSEWIISRESLLRATKCVSHFNSIVNLVKFLQKKFLLAVLCRIEWQTFWKTKLA